ncbi:CD1375 family protein [Vagococcus fluvialis]
MIQVYVSLIKKGLKSIEDVPEIYREEVQVILDSEIQE